MAYPRDLREHLANLEASDKLVRIRGEINKDTQLHPLARLQFRGLPEEERKAFLFENVTDSRGRSYATPVAVCALAASRELYAMGLMCRPEEIGERWSRAQLHPIQPELVEYGPVHEEVHLGDTLLDHGGLDEFPIPISTPGYDVAPFITSPYWITKDPETGVRNVGTYRAHIKAPLRTGIFPSTRDQHVAVHWQKCKAMGRPLEAAIVVGAAPNIGYVAVSKLRRDTDELAVAGGLAGEPVSLVRCKTVDLEVPAFAEIVIEGEISTHEVEPEAPFGEATGYMGQREMMPYFTVKCITHRTNPIWQAFLSQYPPSESSVIKSVAWENNALKHLKHDLKLPSLIAVANHADFGTSRLMVLQMREPEQDDVWQALEGMAAYSPEVSKVVIAVDQDVNPWDADALNWAISYNVQPHRDIRFKRLPTVTFMDYSVAPLGIALTQGLTYDDVPECSLMLVNATRKWPYPPISLPRQQYMEEALRLWDREGLPSLRLKEPWWGYNLGYWSDEEEDEARLATQGAYYRTGEKLSHRRRPS